MFNFEVKTNGAEVDVTLVGRLDASVAPALFAEMEKLKGQSIDKITFHAAELEYIASAGLRVIVFTTQKLGDHTQVYMESASDDVKSVLEMTGCDSFVNIV